ncbi:MULTISPECIES: hemerythrin domain-containing protein [Ramlibacter]|uniref:Hemerythrin domain-containing protein n=1 Tax=Ramlibacter aquaticus TaxID=2780094 RepID=A0ABR9SJD0_9BURK|nr:MULTISPECIES: hemerythrin domain-containing protein [Ramlibacter]MBE7942004.1 hemerythrin domain-containing protein [Ramlibacter aquaticus]
MSLDPVRAWHEEHAYFARLLQLLQAQVDLFHAGETPQYPLMLDILGYLHDYADQVHHPREDEAFRRLRKRHPDQALMIARLEQEHRVIARAGTTLAHLLTQVEAGDAIVRRSEIEMAAATFLVYYTHHLEKEDGEVLPLAARSLTEADWQAIRDCVKPSPDPLFGAQPQQRFRALRHRIALEAA